MHPALHRDNLGLAAAVDRSGVGLGPRNPVQALQGLAPDRLNLVRAPPDLGRDRALIGQDLGLGGPDQLPQAPRNQARDRVQAHEAVRQPERPQENPGAGVVVPADPRVDPRRSAIGEKR